MDARIDVDQKKKAFLNEEFLTLSVNGAVQRANVYKVAPDKFSKRQREEYKNFKEALRERLRELVANYSESVSEEDHMKYIGSLADDLSKQYKGVLRDGRFRIGIAQKALNLYLKYLWCNQVIPCPPHCPFDWKILSQLSSLSKDERRWTETDCMDVYCRWVRSAEKKAEVRHLNLAEWELVRYEEVRRT